MGRYPLYSVSIIIIVLALNGRAWIRPCVQQIASSNLPGVCLFLLGILLLVVSSNALMIMNSLFGFRYLGCQRIRRKNNLFLAPDHTVLNLACPNETTLGILIQFRFVIELWVL